MMRLLKIIDQALGYSPPTASSHSDSHSHSHSHSPSQSQSQSQFQEQPTSSSSLVRPTDISDSLLYNVHDVQEKWVDNQEEWRAWERKKWREEGEIVAKNHNRNKNPEAEDGDGGTKGK